MAVVSGQLKDASIKGKPRDLMDEIFRISPTDTPFLTMCGKTEASQTLHEWQTDELRAPGANSRLEGADTTEFEATTSTELSNKTQILSVACQVSGTAEAVKQAGVGKQMAYQMALRSKELKKDLEYALLSNQKAASGSGSAGRKMTGLPCWFYEAGTYDVAGTAPTASAAAVDGIDRDITEEMVKDMMQSIYVAGGNPDRIMAAPAIRRKLSETLTGGATRMEMVEDKKVHATVDVYVSDFGTLKLESNRVQSVVPYAQNCAFFLDPQYWKVAYLRGFQTKELARTGDSIKKDIIVECTLEARQPKSSGMIADIKA